MGKISVKICGITNERDALSAFEAGADAIGLNFWKKSPRYVGMREAQKIMKSLPLFAQVVGVFVDGSVKMMNQIACDLGLTMIQLHGSEPPSFLTRLEKPVIKAFRLKEEKDLRGLGKYKPYAFLIDAHVEGMAGGTGVFANWNLAKKARRKGRVILAGGLKPDNVGEAIRYVAPDGVDVASGVEINPRRKDFRKMKIFIKRVRDEEEG